MIHAPRVAPTTRSRRRTWPGRRSVGRVLLVVAASSLVIGAPSVASIAVRGVRGAARFEVRREVDRQQSAVPAGVTGPSARPRSSAPIRSLPVLPVVGVLASVVALAAAANRWWTLGGARLDRLTAVAWSATSSRGPPVGA